MTPPLLPVHDPLACHNNDAGNHDDPHGTTNGGLMGGHEFSPQDIRDLLGGVLDEDTAAPTVAARTDPPRDAQRTERKRSREKQRREDLNKQFADLTEGLRIIEADADVDLRGIPSTYSPSNRADLIARTLVVLRSLHGSHTKRKTELEDVREQLARAKQAGEDTAAKLKESLLQPHSMAGAGGTNSNNRVMMMVPMMIGGDGAPTPLWTMPGNGVAQPAQQQQQPQPQAPPVQQPQQQQPQQQQHSQQHSQQQATPTNMTPWGMMPPWMNMAMPQQVAMPMTATAAVPAMSSTGATTTTMHTAATSTTNAGGNNSGATTTDTTKQAPPTSNDGSNGAAIGSNLAHCA